MAKEVQMTKATMAYFWRAAMTHKRTAILIACILVIAISLDLARPFLIKYATDSFSLQLTKQEILPLIIWYFAIWQIIGLFRFIAWRAIGLNNRKFYPRVYCDLLVKCYHYMLGHSYRFFTNNYAGSLQTRVKKFSHAYESVVDQAYYELGLSVVVLVVLTTVLLFYMPTIGLIVLVWLVLYATFTYRFAKFKLRHDIRSSEQDTLITAHLSDTFANHTTIRLFTAEEREVERFTEITDELCRLRKKSWGYSLISELVQGSSQHILEIVVIGYVIYAWYNNSATVGDIIFTISYLSRVWERTWSMGRNIRQVYEQLAYANEMTEMLETPHEIVDSPGAPNLVVKKGQIEFRNVNFGYEAGDEILTDFSLEIPNGAKYALVGPSGAGKSTIVKMMQRLVEIRSGEILIDGQNIARVTQKSLRQAVSLVPQDPDMFGRTLWDNISYGRPNASNEEVIAAAKAAYCHDFIIETPKGYETLVGEKGIKLSGGQRQRVAIARAFLCNSPILILDEATSSLDSESESYIQDALRRLMKGKTVIVIAHRLSTIKAMDWIVVLDKGEIIEQGTHDSLLTLDGKYSHHWGLQSGGFIFNAATA